MKLILYLIATVWSVKSKVSLLNLCSMVQCTPLGVFIDTPMVLYLTLYLLWNCVLHKIDTNRTTVLAENINIDIIKFSNEGVVSYVSTLMSFEYLPYITVSSRITQLSTTCIDYMFMKTSQKDTVLNTMSGLCHGEMNYHLPCFLSLKFEKYNRKDERPMTKILVRKIVPFLYKQCSPKIRMKL